MLGNFQKFWSKNDFGQYSARHFWLSDPHFCDFVKIKKFATYNVKLSTTFVSNIFFSDDFFFGLEGEGIEIFARILLRNFHPFRDVLHK